MISPLKNLNNRQGNNKWNLDGRNAPISPAKGRAMRRGSTGISLGGRNYLFKVGSILRGDLSEASLIHESDMVRLKLGSSRGESSCWRAQPNKRRAIGR